VTESYAALHQYDNEKMEYGWIPVNLKSKMTLDEIRKNPTEAIKTAKEEKNGAWKPLYNRVVKNN